MATDWTVGSDGRSNSSEAFENLIDEVARLIRQEAHFLLQGDTQSAARLIMAQLAHVHGLAPTHPHEHTTHALRDVIESLTRYDPDTNGMAKWEDGEWLRLSDVRAVVHKAATLGAPVAHRDDE